MDCATECGTCGFAGECDASSQTVERPLLEYFDERWVNGTLSLTEAEAYILALRARVAELEAAEKKSGGV